MRLLEYESIGALPEYCQRLMIDSSSSSLYLSRVWFDNIVRTGLEPDVTVHIFSVENREADHCHALLFLRSPAGQNGSTLGRWPILGCTLASLTNFQSSFFSPLFSEAEYSIPQILRLLADGIAGYTPRWDLIDINLLDPEGDVYIGLADAFRQSGYRCKNYCYKGNWFEKFEYKDFSEYLNAREKSSKKSIQNYQRKLRKLEKEERTSIDILRGNKNLDEILGLYHQIYDASWKELDFFPEFYNGLIRNSLETDSLRMVVVYIDEQPVAFEYAIVTGRQCVMMRTAYVADYSRDSVGAIAILCMVRHVIEQDGVQEIDFGTDDDPYKSTWVKQRRERFGIVCFHRSTLLGHYYWLLFCCKSLKNRLIQSVKKSFGWIGAR